MFPGAEYAIAAVVAAALTALAARRFRRAAARDAAWFAGKTWVDGTLARCDFIDRGDDGDHWSSIEYRDQRGIAYQLTGSLEFKPQDVGRTVRVAYDPNLPSDARIVGDKRDRDAAAAKVMLLIVFAASFAGTVALARAIIARWS